MAATVYDSKSQEVLRHRLMEAYHPRRRNTPRVSARKARKAAGRGGITTWWDEADDYYKDTSAEQRDGAGSELAESDPAAPSVPLPAPPLAQGEATEVKPSSYAPPTYTHRTHAHALNYRAAALDERMVLTAVRRRKNELNKRPVFQRQTNPVWNGRPRPPVDPDVDLSTVHEWAYKPVPPKARKAQTARIDHWSGPLRERRNQRQRELISSRDYFGKQDPVLGWTRQRWLQKKEVFQWNVPDHLVTDELDRVNHFITRYVGQRVTCCCVLCPVPCVIAD